MQLPYSKDLNTEYLGQLFDKSYKPFWFKIIAAKEI